VFVCVCLCVCVCASSEVRTLLNGLVLVVSDASMFQGFVVRNSKHQVELCLRQSRTKKQTLPRTAHGLTTPAPMSFGDQTK